MIQIIIDISENLMLAGLYFYWIIIPITFYIGLRLWSGNGTLRAACIFVFCCVLLFGALLGASKLY